jgi:hypothetical protein
MKEANMNIIQKTMTTVALGAIVAVAFGASGGLDPVHARNKSGKIDPPQAQKTVQVPAETPTPPAEQAERGIKDQGVKGCNGCGLTGREAAPGTGEAPAQGGTPPSADHQWFEVAPKHLRVREAAPGTGEAPAEGGPGGGPRVDAQGAGDPKVTEKKKRKGPKERDDSIYNNSKTSLLPVLGGVAALAALVVAVSGGNDAPTSP